jgi:DNA-binding transcriptional regulator YiaG
MSRKCTDCGQSCLESMIPTLYHYKMSGLDNVYLKGGVEEYICSKCGRRSTAIRNLLGLHRAIATSLALAKRRLAGNELRFLREQLGFSAEELANLVEYSEEYIRKIESGTTAPKAPYEMFLRVAVMRGIKAPNYDLRELSQRKKYQLEELRFINEDRDWKIAA